MYVPWRHLCVQGRRVGHSSVRAGAEGARRLAGLVEVRVSRINVNADGVDSAQAHHDVDAEPCGALWPHVRAWVSPRTGSGERGRKCPCVAIAPTSTKRATRLRIGFLEKLPISASYSERVHKQCQALKEHPPEVGWDNSRSQGGLADIPVRERGHRVWIVRALLPVALVFTRPHEPRAAHAGLPPWNSACRQSLELKGPRPFRIDFHPCRFPGSPAGCRGLSRPGVGVWEAPGRREAKSTTIKQRARRPPVHAWDMWDSGPLSQRTPECFVWPYASSSLSSPAEL